jgi:hypothetical protein
VPGDPKRSVLSGLKRPLMQPVVVSSQKLEEHLLGGEQGATTPMEAPQQEHLAEIPRAVTTPVTFHLPVELRDKLKLTAQAKQKTMVEIATEALRSYLEKNPVSESDLRRMLGL